MKTSASKTSSTIVKLYPELTPDEQHEAEYNLGRYVSLVWRIYRRTRSKNEKFDEKPFKR
jgi:hypothetical protein